MLRRLAITAIIALATPTLAMARGYEEHHPPGRPPPGPFRGEPPARYMHHGRPLNLIYTTGWAYGRLESLARRCHRSS